MHNEEKGLFMKMIFQEMLFQLSCSFMCSTSFTFFTSFEAYDLGVRLADYYFCGHVALQQAQTKMP